MPNKLDSFVATINIHGYVENICDNCKFYTYYPFKSNCDLWGKELSNNGNGDTFRCDECLEMSGYTEIGE
jgi:hypothetical protein